MPAAFWPVRVAAGHWRTIAAGAAGLAAYPMLPEALGSATRSVIAWDVAALSFLCLAALMFLHEGSDARMAENARRQQEGEWTMFLVTLSAVCFCFTALISELGEVKNAAPEHRGLHVGLVVATLLLSWLATHTVFALRYAHEYYSRGEAASPVEGGLKFPSDDCPDYWDFMYFSLVLGMTFQVSDVAISSRKIRRLAMAHGLISFLFDTVVVALTVNIGAQLLE